MKLKRIIGTTHHIRSVGMVKHVSSFLPEIEKKKKNLSLTVVYTTQILNFSHTHSVLREWSLLALAMPMFHFYLHIIICQRAVNR